MRIKLIFVLLFSILIVPTAVSAKEISRTDFVSKMNVLFLKGDYTSLIAQSENGIKRYRLGGTKKKEIMYLAALSYVKTGDFIGGRKIFNNILRMKGSKFREEAYIGIADSYFNEGKYEAAIESYDAALNRYPRSHRMSGIYHNLALSYKAQKNSSKANFYLTKIKNLYDKSFEASKTVFVPRDTATKYYVVQLGAFSSLKNAKKLLKKLSGKKYDAYIQKTKRDGKALYKIKGGKFSNESYASRLVRKLKRDGFHAKITVE